MRSLRRHKLGLLSRAALPGAAVIALVLVALLVRFVAPDAFMFLARPLLDAGTAATGATKHAFPEDAAALRSERDALLAENRTLRNENETLRSSRGTSLPQDGAFEAPVITRPPLSPYDVLVVAVPPDRDVLPGALAYAEGVPIGKVTDRNGTSLRVLLFSSGGEKTEGWIGEALLPATIEGRGAGAFVAGVPRDAGIAEGATVFLPGPGAVAAGTVLRVEGNPSSPEAVLVIRSLVNPFSLSTVRILPAP